MITRCIAAGLIALAAHGAALAATVPAPQEFLPMPQVDESLFPPGAERSFILETCQGCHTLNLVARNGGDVADWSDRLVRMIRAGAPITRQEIPALAAYLASAFPRRVPASGDGPTTKTK